MIEDRQVERYDWRDASLLIALIVAASTLFILTRDRLIDPIIDVGRDLYIPTILLDGKKLYRDILYYYPPLAPYLLAAWCFLFGSTLLSYALFGAVTSLVMMVALYVAARVVAGRAAAFAAALLFVGWSMSGASTWGCNFIFPYAHAATIGMTAAVVMIAALLRHLFAERTRLSLAVAMSAGFLAAWSKIEMALLVAIVLAVAALVYRLSIRALVAFAVAAAGSLAAVTAYFSDAGAGHTWLGDNVLPRSLLDSAVAKRFYAQVSGVSQWQALVVESLAATAVLAAVVLLLRWLNGDRSALQRIAGSGAILLLEAGLLYQHWLFRAWSLLMIVALITGLKQRSRTPLLLLVAATAAATWRIALRLAPVWYGFTLAIPLFLLMTYVLFEALPSLSLYRRRAALLWLPVFLASALLGLVENFNRLSAKTHRVDSLRGSFFDSNEDRAAVINEFLSQAKAMEIKEIAFIPEGLTLNYFTSTRTPLTVQTFTPVEADFPEMENMIVEELTTRRPEYIGMVSRDVTEFGYRGWGVDYNRDAGAFVRSHYRVVRAWQRRGCYLILLKRSPANA